MVGWKPQDWLYVS